MQSLTDPHWTSSTVPVHTWDTLDLHHSLTHFYSSKVDKLFPLSFQLPSQFVLYPVLPCITIHCSLYSKHSSQMTVMTEGIKWNKNMYPDMSSLSLPLAAVGYGFRQRQLVQKGPKMANKCLCEKCLFFFFVSPPVSRSARRCAAEWDRCGAAPGSRRSCYWNTETSHSQHPLNSPGNSESQLREKETKREIGINFPTVIVPPKSYVLLCCILLDLEDMSWYYSASVSQKEKLNTSPCQLDCCEFSFLVRDHLADLNVVFKLRCSGRQVRMKGWSWNCPTCVMDKQCFNFAESSILFQAKKRLKCT